MSRGLSKQLEDMVRSKLGELVNGKPGSMVFTPVNTDPLERDAINYLEDIGAFEHLGTGSFRVTAQGRGYWEKLNAPRWYWFRQNWFPASVAAGTILFSAAAATANILNLVT